MVEIKKFNQIVYAIALLSYLIIAVVFYYIIPSKFHLSLLIVPIFEAVVTSLLHKKLILTSNERPQKFINMFMAVTGIKLMLYLFFILIFIVTLTEFAIPFLAIFFPLYIIYTIIEINQLLAFFNKLKL